MSPETKLNGIVAGLYLGNRPGTLVSTSLEQVQVDFAGFIGDQHAGWTRKSDSRTPQYLRGTEIRNNRQVSLVSVEELTQVAQIMALPELRAEWVGANLLLTGVPRLSLLPPSTRLIFEGGVVLIVTSINHPCKQAGRAIQQELAALGHHHPDLAEQFPKAARGLRGVVAVIEHPGQLCRGASVEVHVPTLTAYSV